MPKKSKSATIPKGTKKKATPKAPKKSSAGKCKTSLEACGDCPAVCCHDLTINIKKPKNLYELDVLKWQLNYDTVGVYIRNRRWHLLVKGRCRFLGDDNLCTIYDDRFDICRDHKPPLCEWYDDWYDFIFTHPDELDAYYKAQKKGKKPPIPKGQWASKGAGRGAKKGKGKKS